MQHQPHRSEALVVGDACTQEWHILAIHIDRVKGCVHRCLLEKCIPYLRIAYSVSVFRIGPVRACERVCVLRIPYPYSVLGPCPPHMSVATHTQEEHQGNLIENTTFLIWKLVKKKHLPNLVTGKNNKTIACAHPKCSCRTLSCFWMTP